MKLPLILSFVFMLLLTSNSYAMWFAIPDAQLIKQASLIVKAQYIGATTITISKNTYRIGVLAIKETLKGKEQNVAFIRLTESPKGLPERSDRMNFSVNQSGLWILQQSTQQGIYTINTPQHFIAEQKLKNRLPQLLPLIKK